MQDYKDSHKTTRTFRQHLLAFIWHTILLIALVIVSGKIYKKITKYEQELEISQPEITKEEPLLELPTYEQPIPIALPAPSPEWKTMAMIVKPKQNISMLFKKAHLSNALLVKLSKSHEIDQALRRIKPKDKLIFYYDNKQALKRLEIIKSLDKKIVIQEEEQGFILRDSAQVSTQAVEPKPASKVQEPPAPEKPIALEKPKPQEPAKPALPPARVVRGTVKNSLYKSVLQAGLPKTLATELINIFAGKIDLQKEVHTGDHFYVMYEIRNTSTNKKAKASPSTNSYKILAAELRHNNTIYQAIYFDKDDKYAGYYTASGDNLKPGFLRYPVKFHHISSPFNLRRRHPILNIVRPHTGVDFAAPYGTPIYSSANGRIAFIGRKGGYGKSVFIDHGRNIQTVYGHLSNYARSLQQGSAVKQGQVIGYVGSTGMSSGAHLHYEVRINSIPHNPLKVALPSDASLPKKYRLSFISYAQKMLAELHRK